MQNSSVAQRAKFHLTAVVLELATWAMMLPGFGIQMGVVRYHRRNYRIVYA